MCCNDCDYLCEASEYEKVITTTYKKSKSMKTLLKFNVLNYDFNKIEKYDVLPYFRNEWKNRTSQSQNIKSKDELKKWIEDKSRYMYWSRCEYEFLMASWPFGSLKMHNEIKEFFKKPQDLDDYSTIIDFDNIVIRDMQKIDIHTQIMMNIDVITNILYEEFKLDK